MSQLQQNTAVKDSDSKGTSRVFYIATLVVSVFISGVLMANVIYYSKIKKAGGNASVSKGEADIMLWFNVIMMIAALLIALFALAKLFMSGSTQQNVSDYLSGNVPSVKRA